MQRDVPGLTRAALPVITNEDWMRGVKMLSVGVNGGSAPPAVPWNQPFLWRDEGTNSQIIAMWHPGVEFVQVLVLVMFRGRAQNAPIVLMATRMHIAEEEGCS